MAAHGEFAIKQTNPTFVGMGSVGASQPSHFDTQCTQNRTAAPQSSPLGTALGQAQVFAQYNGQTDTMSLTDQEPWASHLAKGQPS